MESRAIMPCGPLTRSQHQHRRKIGAERSNLHSVYQTQFWYTLSAFSIVIGIVIDE